jgi:hypothetical protein
MGQTVNVKRQIIENDIKLFQAKADLQNKLIKTYSHRGVTERRLVLEFAANLLHVEKRPELGKALSEWFEAHQAETAAQIDIYRVQLAEFESQIQIRQAMLVDGDRLVVDPRQKM